MVPGNKIIIPPIHYEDFLYKLPEERIASYPLKNRDESKLLLYKSGEIQHHHFHEIEVLLPKNSLLFFNNTKVIPARIPFKKDTGAKIELFLLQPEVPSKEIHKVMQVKGGCEWSCMIGNLKRWKEGTALQKELFTHSQKVCLSASLINKAKKLVRFEWNDGDTRFVDIVEAAGEVPLPPYIKRKPVEADKGSYQTVYSREEGAVAAPTAGLHFTENIITKLRARGVITDFLTLHVSAGTFQPIKEKNILSHPMHVEQMQTSRQNLVNLLKPNKNIIPVGTTSMRTLESLYWFGVKLLKEGDETFKVQKLYPYQFLEDELPGKHEAIQAILGHMDNYKTDTLFGETEIFIFPGYKFKLCEGLITNFHMPGSTLILLVAAFTGKDWRKIYRQALENDYRFLSYGDGSLLLP